MATVSLLTCGERSRIWQLHRQLDIPAPRLAHIRQVTTNYMEMRRGSLGRFYRILSPENRKFEDKKAYDEKIGWLFDTHNRITPENQANLEAGIRLHDIGYGGRSDKDHEEVGGEMLQDGRIFKKLRLSAALSEERIKTIVRFHGLYTDIGFLYKPETVAAIDPQAQLSLYITSAVDSTAKPLSNGRFHSMLFSRLIERYMEFDRKGVTVSVQNRLRQLFGPINYVWLDDKGMDGLDNTEGCRELKARTGFRMMVERSFVNCWPLFKDLVTPEISFATDYYTRTNPMLFPDLLNLLSALSDIMEERDSGKDFLIMTDPSINYRDFANRPAVVSAVRRSFADRNASLSQNEEDIYSFGEIRFSVSEPPENTTIMISTAKN